MEDWEWNVFGLTMPRHWSHTHRLIVHHKSWEMVSSVARQHCNQGRHVSLIYVLCHSTLNCWIRLWKKLFLFGGACAIPGNLSSEYMYCVYTCLAWVWLGLAAEGFGTEVFVWTISTMTIVLVCVWQIPHVLIELLLYKLHSHPLHTILPCI